MIMPNAAGFTFKIGKTVIFYLLKYFQKNQFKPPFLGKFHQFPVIIFDVAMLIVMEIKVSLMV